MKLGKSIYNLSGKILCPSIELSLTLSLLGGQSFRWKQIQPDGGDNMSNRFQGVFKARVWTLWQDTSHLHYTVHSPDKLDEKDVEMILRDYFRLDENLPDLYREWSGRDPFFKQTCGEFVGIRMLNQDLVENLFSFLCSSNNNIARISGMIDKMCSEYGTLIYTQCKQQVKPISSPGDISKSEKSIKRARNSKCCPEVDEKKDAGKTDRVKASKRVGKPLDSVDTSTKSVVNGTKDAVDLEFHAFPTIEVLAEPGVEAKLRQLGFGYRAKFIQKSAEYISQNGGVEWLSRLQGMSYEEARTELQNLPGIGAKVADCICLMSLSHLQSVPVDTHVYQIACNHYHFAKLSTKTLTPAVYNQIRSFFIEKFGPYAGWAHSILFCADLKKFQTKPPPEGGKGVVKSKGRKRKGSV